MEQNNRYPSTAVSLLEIVRRSVLSWPQALRQSVWALLALWFLTELYQLTAMTWPMNVPRWFLFNFLLIFYVMVLGFSFFRIHCRLTGQSVTLQETFVRVWRHFWDLFFGFWIFQGAGFLIAVLLPFLILKMAALISAPPAAAIFLRLLFASVGLLMASLLYLFSIPLTVTEDLSVSQALRASFELVWKRGFNAFIVYALIIISVALLLPIVPGTGWMKGLTLPLRFVVAGLISLFLYPLYLNLVLFTLNDLRKHRLTW